MFDHPLYFRYTPSPDGYISVALLFFVPLVGRFSGWVCSLLGDYQMQGMLLGRIICYAFSLGFALSALRQPFRSTRVLGGIALLASVVVFFLMLPASQPD